MRLRDVCSLCRSVCVPTRRSVCSVCDPWSVVLCVCVCARDIETCGILCGVRLIRVIRVIWVIWVIRVIRVNLCERESVCYTFTTIYVSRVISFFCFVLPTF